MKKVFTLFLAAVLLMSGCSNSSQERKTSLTENNSSSKAVTPSTVISSSAGSSTVISSANMSSNKSIVYSEPPTSETNSAKQEFLSKINDLLSYYDVADEIVAARRDDDNCFLAEYSCYKFDRDDNYEEVYIMFYTEDITTVCDIISKEVLQLNEWYDKHGTWYSFYINDRNNDHIVSIRNWDFSFSGNKFFLQLCWYNAEMQNKYKQIENNEAFKDFTIRVLNN